MYAAQGASSRVQVSDRDAFKDIKEHSGDVPHPMFEKCAGKTIRQQVENDCSFFDNLPASCWTVIEEYLSARDIVIMRHLIPHLINRSKNLLLVNVLVERYYSKNPSVQSIYRRQSPPGFFRGLAPLQEWMQKNLTEDDKSQIEQDSLKQAALSRYLSNRIKTVTVNDLFSGHRDSAVTALSTLPGRRLIIGFVDKTLRVVRIKQAEKNMRQSIANLRGHRFAIKCIITLPNEQIVTGSDDDLIKIWDLTKPEIQRNIVTLSGHFGCVMCLALLKDGLLVSGSNDKTIKVWDLERQECLATLRGAADVSCLATLHDGRIIAGFYDNTLKVLDLTRGLGLEHALTLRGHTRTVRSVLVLPNGYIISSSEDKKLKVWDLTRASGNECIKTLFGHKGNVQCLVQISDGRIISGSDDRKIKVWNLTSVEGRMLLNVDTYRGSLGEISSLIQLDSGEIVAGFHDSENEFDEYLRIWDLYGYIATAGTLLGDLP